MLTHRGSERCPTHYANPDACGVVRDSNAHTSMYIPSYRQSNQTTPVPCKKRQPLKAPDTSTKLLPPHLPHGMHPITIPPSIPPRRRHESPGNLHPLRNTTPLLPLHIDHIRITPTPTPDPILLLRVPLSPVLVLLSPGFLVQRRALEIGFPRELARGRVGRAVLDRGVAVAEVAEVVDI